MSKPTIKDLQHKLNMANGTVAKLMKEVEQRKNDFSYLEEKYLSLSEAHTNLNAENHSLRKEIERTNRHINLAENQLHKEQQPLVVNHYHNCTINK